MKWHFIYPDVGTYYYPSVHHGLAQLSSVLKAGGHQVSLHHIKKEPTEKKLWDEIEKEKPDSIGFTAMSNQIEYVKLWSKWIKEKYDVPIICGGVHATLNPKVVLQNESIDGVCVGEGELSIMEGNYWIKRNGIVVKSKPYPLVENLDQLPFPDYSLFDCTGMLRARNGNFAVILSRGCPYHCTYCCNNALQEKQKGLGNFFRYRSVDNSLELLENLIDKYPIKSFSFADDVFGIAKEWVYEFCEKYPRRIGLPFECNLRVEMVTKELLKILRMANCTKVELGIESGNEWMRNKVLNRHMSNQQIINAFDEAHRLGLRTRAYNMIGLPYETPEMIRETINLNKRVSPDQLAIFYFYPFRGTELYNVCKKEGFLSDRGTNSYVTDSVLNLPTITHEKLGSLYNEFYRLMIVREIQAYPSMIRLPLSAVRIFIKVITGGNEVRVIRYLYMRLFGIFQALRGAK